MTLSFSSEVMKAVGFRPMEASDAFPATFSSITSFEVQGFTPETDDVKTLVGTVAGHSYRLAVGKSVNAVCRALVNDDLAAGEAEWAKEQRSTPPYVLVLLGPTSLHSCSSGHIKVNDASTTTYDGFPQARAELRSIEAKVLPGLVSALSFAFNGPDRAVKFRFLTRDAFGRTPDGRLVHDVRLELRASAYGSHAISSAELETLLDRVSRLALRANPKVTRFFHLALSEEDALKRFLYFFLAIEIETHATFASIDHTAKMTTLVRGDVRLKLATEEFFNAQRERLVALKDRFVWCAMCAWTNLTDYDIELFKSLKKIRDDIAHGSITAPPESAVMSAQKLAEKLHQHYA